MTAERKHERLLVKNILQPKTFGGEFGGVERYNDMKKEGKYNISRKEIKEWLMKQDAYMLHKPVRRHFKRNCRWFR